MEQTLRQEFEHAQSLYSSLFNSPELSDARTDEYQSRLRETIDAFESTKRKSENVSLFSLNETLDDLATTNIPFLNIDYYLATLTDKIFTASIGERRPLALKSKGLYLSFLTLCDSYEILPDDQKNLLRGILKSDIETPSFMTEFARGYSDPGSQRQAKIAKYKREKALESRIAELQMRNRAEDDEDVARELYLKQVALFVDRAFDAVQGIDSELEILKFAAEHEPKQDPVPAESDTTEDGYSERVDMPRSKAILTADGKVNRPFMIVSSRDQVRRNVFRPDYELPTMTVEEYLDEEMKRGNIISGGGPQSEEPVEKDEDDEEANDKETMRLRQWDDFTEANPRGSGNTKMNRG